jgi:hypothetical protein
MNTLLFSLELLASILLFTNKIYVRKGRPLGWLLGIAGTSVMDVYFILLMQKTGLDLWIAFIYQIALAILMLFGYLVALQETSTNQLLRRRIQTISLPFKSFVVFLTISFAAYLLYSTFGKPLVWEQFWMTFFGMLAFLLLAFRKRLTNILGWAVILLAHISAIALMLPAGGYVVCFFQMISSIIAIQGIIQEFKSRPPD